MAAGLGFKDFVTGEVLTAADVDGYLMQGIWVFANATARDAAVTSPQEGNSCYLKDTDVIQVYSGSAWVTKSGGSSPLTTKGDLYTYSTTDARLGVGTNGQVLTADSAEATGLKWAAAASGGGMTLLSTTTMSGASTTISGISGSYTDLLIIAYDMNPSTTAGVYIRPNATSGLVDSSISTNYGSTSTTEGYRSSDIKWNGGQNLANANNGVMVTIYQYANTSISFKPFHSVARSITTASPSTGTTNAGGTINTGSAISSIQLGIDSGTLTGTVLIYGVK